MITFVLYDDQSEFRSKSKKLIKELMYNTETKYEVKEFIKFDNEFEQTIKETKTNKIYILDIEVPNNISGIEVAKLIREKDWDSSIIMLTSHVELGYQALKAQIMLLDFIAKCSAWEGDLEHVIKKAISQADKTKTLVFENQGITYRVYTDDILYVYKEQGNRRCIIQTTYNKFVIPKNLNEIKELLDNRFFLSHRSCYVNTTKIKQIDSKNCIIIFDNNVTTDFLSRDRKKALKEYVRSI